MSSNNDDHDEVWEPGNLPDSDGPCELSPEHSRPSCIWCIPALLSEGSRPSAAALATLVMFFLQDNPSQDRHLSDCHDPIDPIATQCLRRGFGLVTSIDVETLGRLPNAPGLHASWASTSRTLRITDDDHTAITEPLDILSPSAWTQSLAQWASLVVLVASHIEAGQPDAYPDGDPLGNAVMASLDRTRLSGCLVGARIPLAS